MQAQKLIGPRTPVTHRIDSGVMREAGEAPSTAVRPVVREFKELFSQNASMPVEPTIYSPTRPVAPTVIGNGSWSQTNIREADGVTEMHTSVYKDPLVIPVGNGLHASTTVLGSAAPQLHGASPSTALQNPILNGLDAKARKRLNRLQHTLETLATLCNDSPGTPRRCPSLAMHRSSSSPGSC